MNSFQVDDLDSFEGEASALPESTASGDAKSEESARPRSKSQSAVPVVNAAVLGELNKALASRTALGSADRKSPGDASGSHRGPERAQTRTDSDVEVSPLAAIRGGLK